MLFECEDHSQLCFILTFELGRWSRKRLRRNREKSQGGISTEEMNIRRGFYFFFSFFFFF